MARRSRNRYSESNVASHSNPLTSFAMGAAFLVVLLIAPCAAKAESRYAIDLAGSKSNILRVRLETACSSLPCDFQLPAWSATYQMRNFSQYLGPVRAEKLRI